MRGRRDQQLHFRVSKPELDRIQVKMAELGIVSIGAYLRKMALDGYCIRLDLKELNRMAYLLQMCSNNLNQYAKRANESGRVYQTDIEDLRARLDESVSPNKFWRSWPPYEPQHPCKGCGLFLYCKRTEKSLQNKRSARRTGRMDRDFMCFFYRNILPERTEVAVQGNIPYHKAEEMVREMEDELHARIDDETWNLYLKISDLAGEAQRMLGEALYLQGAEDREHMLQ